MTQKKWSDMPPSDISYLINGNKYYILWNHTNENQNESPPGRPIDWADPVLGLDSNFGYDNYYYTLNYQILNSNDGILSFCRT